MKLYIGLQIRTRIENLERIIVVVSILQKKKIVVVSKKKA